MVSNEYRNLNTDSTLGGNTASDYQISSQKAIKEYIDYGKELPLGFGLWCERDISSDKMKQADGVTTLSADDFPEMWELLTGILDGTIECEDMDVCETSDVSTIAANVKDWEHTNGALKVSHFYKVDLTNRTFILPTNISKNLCIGNNRPVVVQGDTNYAGHYSILSCGNYAETDFFARLEKDSRTDGEDTFEHYKLTQWSDSTEEITTEEVSTQVGTLTHTAYQTTEELNIPIAQTLLDTDYRAQIYTGAAYSDAQDGKTLYRIDQPYFGTFDENKTTTSYATKLYVYDEEYKNNVSGVKVIGDNETERYLMIRIEGTTAPPAVSSYTTNKRLYIKVAK